MTRCLLDYLNTFKVVEIVKVCDAHKMRLEIVNNMQAMCKMRSEKNLFT